MVKIVNVDKTLSPAGGGVWVQVHDYQPEGEEEQKKRGRLLALISVTDLEEGETMKLVELGREVLAFLHEQYYGELQMGVLIRLKESLLKVEEEFGDRVEMAVLTEVGEVLYVGILGKSRVYAYLDGKSGFVGLDNNLSIRVFSFVKKPKVKIVLGTGNFWEKFGEGRIKGLLESDRNGRELAEELGVVIGSEEVGAGTGGVMVRLDEEEKEIEEIETRAERHESVVWRANFWDQIRASAHKTSEKVAFLPKINLGVAFIVLLIVMVVAGGIVRNYRANRGREITEKLTEIEQKLKEADILSGTNGTRSLEIVAEVKSELEKLKGIKNDKVGELSNLMTTVEEAANGLVRVEIKEVLDGGLLREGTVLASLVKSGKNILALDKQNGRMVRISIDKDSGEVVMGSEELSGVRSMAEYSGNVYLLGSFGIKECAETTWKCSVKINSGDTPSGATAIGVWGGNIYVLDGQEGRIWKYAKSGNEYGKKSSWMEADSEVLGAENILIDGRIWIGFLNGGIGKYNQGAKENFELTGLSNSLGGNSQLYTSDEEVKLYVLDPTNSRVVVLDKDGLFLKQYVNDKFKEAAGVVVYEDRARIYLSIGSKIMMVETP